MEDERTWFVPAYIVTQVREGVEPGPEDVVLFCVVDIVSQAEHIPVFDEFTECDEYLGTISPTGKRDRRLAIFAFASLAEIRSKVKKLFGRRIKLQVSTAGQVVRKKKKSRHEEMLEGFGEDE